MKTNFTPGQIIYSKSDDCWVYISVLRNIQPQNTSGAMQLHTCCDISIDGDDGSKTLVFARGNGTLLDVDTTFEEVREATDKEKMLLYDALVKAYKDYDLGCLGWKDTTYSTYHNIRNWLCLEFDVDINLLPNDSALPATIYEITYYIWDAICKETTNSQEKTTEPEMVNKTEFIAKVKRWLEFETNWNMEYDEEGRNDDYGKIDELIKYLEK